MKLLMITYGYSHDLEVGTYNDASQGFGYYVSGKNAKGSEFYEDGCNNIIYMIEQIISRMQRDGVQPRSSFWWQERVADVLNDEWRNKFLQTDYARKMGL